MTKERNWQKIDKITSACYLLFAMIVVMVMTSTVASAVELSGGVINTGNKPRVIVSTDIGGSDPDDFQSMVHYLVYADVFDTEGLISSPPQGGRKQDILDTLAKYEIDYPNLSSWSDYPTPDSLRAVTKQGAIQPQSGYTPLSTISNGAQHIIDRANAADSRPLYILVWGSITDVAQAVHKDPSIKQKIRVYSIGSWNTREDPKARDYLYNNHTDGSDSLWWIENDSTFRGMYACAESSGTYGNTDWPLANIDNHGALGEWFMDKKSTIKMGDTPSVLYMLTGDPSDPGGESWGGSFAARSSVGPTFWDDRTESSYRCGGKSGAYTVHKWRQQCFDDWEMRMDHAKDSSSPGDTTPPSQVDGVTANAVSDSQIDLSWNAAGDPESGVASYNVYRDGGQVANLGGTSYSDTGLSPSTTYSYEIAAVNGAGLEGSKSSSVSETTDSITLRPPDNPADTTAGIEYEVFDGSWGSLPDFDSLTPAETGVMSVIDITAGRDGTDNFGMRWNGYVQVPSDADYTFYTASDDGSQLFIGDTLVVDNDGLHGVTEQSGTIGLQAGLHAITVTFFEASGGEAIDVSFEGGGLSKQEIPAGNLYYTGDSPVDPPAAPSGLAASAVSSSRIDLSWTDNASDEDGFKIERKTGSGGTWSQIDTAVADATVYSDTGLSASTAYYYRVRAYNTGGDSAYSNEASATTDDGTTPSGASIGVNFSNSEAGEPPVAHYGGRPLMPTDTAGAEAQHNWNNFNPDNTRQGVLSWDGSAWVLNNPGTYVDSDGNDTTLTVTDSGFAAWNTNDTDVTTGDDKLMRGTNGYANKSFTVSNVPYTTYDLIVYLMDRNNDIGETSGASITDGTTTFYVDPNTLFGTSHAQMSSTTSGNPDAGTYVKFTGLSGSTTISFNHDGAAGFQIVSTDGGGTTPSSWENQDIGNVGAAGSVSESDGTFTIEGSGADIWSGSDAFHFMYQQMSGDCEITARVESVENTNSWAKAGVMIRETLNADSVHAMTAVTPGNGVSFQRRTTTGGTSTDNTDIGITAPHWVKIVRSGDSFSAYRSTDGSSWTQIGSTISITMSSTVYVGLPVTSHNNGTLCTAVFDNVTLQ